MPSKYYDILFPKQDKDKPPVKGNKLSDNHPWKVRARKTYRQKLERDKVDQKK